MSQHPFERAYQEVSRLRETDGLLAENETTQPPDFLATLANKEIGELLAELNRPNEIDNVATAGEFHDVMVFLLSAMMIRHPDMRPAEQLGGVNGYGKHSGAYDNLQPVIAESGRDPRAMRETLRRMASIWHNFPVPNAGFEYFDRTIEKVLANRPPALYNGLDPLTGKALTGDEATVAFFHFEQGLRLIRNDVQRTLKPADWQPHFLLLADWQNSATNLALLEQQLRLPQPDHDIVVTRQSGVLYQA